MLTRGMCRVCCVCICNNCLVVMFLTSLVSVSKILLGNVSVVSWVVDEGVVQMMHVQVLVPWVHSYGPIGKHELVVISSLLRHFWFIYCICSLYEKVL